MIENNFSLSTTALKMLYLPHSILIFPFVTFILSLQSFIFGPILLKDSLGLQKDVSKLLVFFDTASFEG